MARKRRHWADRVADDLRERVRLAIPAVAAALQDEVPVGYEPRRPTADQANEFLAMNGQQRLELFRSMSPEEYKTYSSQLMQTLTRRYGPAAEALLPLLEATEMQATLEDIPGQPQMDPVAVARMQLTDYLGIDPFGDL